MEFTRILIIYRWSNASGHGIIKIDGINGDDNTYLKQNMCMIGTEEFNNESMKMNAVSIMCDKNKELKLKVFMNNDSSCVHIKIVKLG